MFDRTLLSTLLVFSGALLVLYLLNPLIPALCLALVLIYVTTPLADFFQTYVKKRFLAASASFLVIILSFLLLSLLLMGEIIQEVARLPEFLQTQQVFVDLNLFQRLSESELIRNLLTENGIKLVINAVAQLGNAAIQLFFGVLISFFVVWKKVAIPVKDEKIRECLHIIDRGIRSVVVSLLLTAVVTGLISIPIYYLFGLPYPLFLAVLTAFLTLLPVIGAWLLYLPVTGYLFFVEGPQKAVIFLGLCAVFISTLPDFLVRPVAGKTKEVGAVPLLIGFTSGLMVFGISGIVLGPLIVIAAIAFWKVYLEKDQ
jgi:predicted PurR-regulated permease PerM